MALPLGLDALLPFFGGGVMSQQSAYYERMLRDQLAGRGPSLASTMLQNQAARNNALMAGMASTRQGVNSALALRNAQLAAVEANRQAMAQAAQQRAQEQLAAQQMFGALSGAREAASQAAAGKMFGALGDIVSQSSLLSDERAKRDVSNASREVDRLLDALEAKRYRYRRGVNEPASEQIGVLAQDVEHAAPDLVTRRPDGYLGIDIPRMVGAQAAMIARLHDRLSALEARLGGR